MNHKGHKGHQEEKPKTTHRNDGPLSDEEERIVHSVIGAAIDVHRALGPGFMETVYERALPIALRARGLPFAQQREIPVTFSGHLLCSHRLDLVVQEVVVVEIKAVKLVRPVHRAQILSYLKASGYRVGLLMNFNVPLLVDGLERFAR